MTFAMPIPEFRPTWDEFVNFNLYMENLDSNPIATSAGAVKVMNFILFSICFMAFHNVFSIYVCIYVQGYSTTGMATAKCAI